MLARVFRLIKRLLPYTLFGRALLILVVPTILVQAVALYVFYARHWESITRNNSASLVGEISLLVNEMKSPSVANRKQWTTMAKDQLGMTITFTRRPLALPKEPDPRFNQFRKQLKTRVKYPAMVEQPDDDSLIVKIELPDRVMNVAVSKKRLLSSTTSIFTIWLTGSSVALLLIAILFLRNQVRPISRLAKAAEGFGMGIDDPELRPAGSKEVRQATRAFLTMKARITRQLATRTAMLSGISHDLRTPLTRIKLQLAMLPSPEHQAMEADVREMEQMITEYLDFARGEDGQLSEPTKLSDLLEATVQPYRALDLPVALTVEDDATLPLRRPRMKRAFDNLITNALRYGGVCRVMLSVRSRHAVIRFEDDGPGIPEGDQALVFQPFRRLEDSRNSGTGGVGLGLTIAREAIMAQGGSIELSNRVVDHEVIGLRVTVRLPLPIV